MLHPFAVSRPEITHREICSADTTWTVAGGGESGGGDRGGDGGGEGGLKHAQSELGVPIWSVPREHTYGPATSCKRTRAREWMNLKARTAAYGGLKRNAVSRAYHRIVAGDVGVDQENIIGVVRRAMPRRPRSDVDSCAATSVPTFVGVDPGRLERHASTFDENTTAETISGCDILGKASSFVVVDPAIFDGHDPALDEDASTAVTKASRDPQPTKNDGPVRDEDHPSSILAVKYNSSAVQRANRDVLVDDQHRTSTAEVRAISEYELVACGSPVHCLFQRPSPWCHAPHSRRRGRWRERGRQQRRWRRQRWRWR